MAAKPTVQRSKVEAVLAAKQSPRPAMKVLRTVRPLQRLLAGLALFCAAVRVGVLWIVEERLPDPTVSTAMDTGPDPLVQLSERFGISFRWRGLPPITVIITAFSLTGQLLTASIVAYGFARFRFPGRDALFLLVLSTLMLPIHVMLIPRFILFFKLGWIDTFLPLIVPSFFGGSAFAIFLLRQFFMNIPRELDDAARIDGASYPRHFLFNPVAALSVRAVGAGDPGFSG